MKVALIAGTSISDSTIFDDWESRDITTSHGTVALRTRGDLILINRHGPGVPLPPHRINHRANVRAVADLGYADVLSINSVGSLRPDLPPGSVVSCSDYVCLQTPPVTFFDDELKGGKPGLANNLIPRISEAAGIPIVTDQVYVQTRGPRFETRAEIRILRQWGDVVGMNLAYEADLCAELGLNGNSLGIVDNFANGIEGEEIDFKRFHALVKANRDRVDALLVRLIEIFQ